MPETVRTRGIRVPRLRWEGLWLRWAWVASAAGALWGAVSYMILWGSTSVQVSRRFVDSNAGLASLLPVRLVLESIRLMEDHFVHHPFDFSSNHAWIGFVSTAVGAVLLAIPVVMAGAAARRLRRGRSRAAGRSLPTG